MEHAASITLVEVDLQLAKEHTHPDFNEKDYFLADVMHSLRIGKFVKVWFGWHFSCGWGASGGMQFDAPGFKWVYLEKSMESRRV